VNRSSRDEFSDQSSDDGKFNDENFDDENFDKDLLGYVLGALDGRETQQIDQLIRESSDLEDELQLIRMSIAPLEQLDSDTNPPVGLARRTSESVASFRSQRSANVSDSSNKSVTSRPSSKMSETEQNYRLFRHTASRRDMAAIAASIIVLAAVAFPVINNNRFYAQVVHCQNNLHEAGKALLRYADVNGGKFVAIPRQGNLSVAGVFAPTLLDQGFVEDESLFYCVSRQLGLDKPPGIPSVQQVINARGIELIQMQREMSGDLAYSMGYVSNGRYVVPENKGRAFFVLLADSPSPEMPGRGSSNHGGYGQNCFFEDGHISFVRNNSVAGDAIYENDLGQIAPGTHELDNVVAPSYARLNFSSGLLTK